MDKNSHIYCYMFLITLIILCTVVLYSCSSESAQGTAVNTVQGTYLNSPEKIEELHFSRQPSNALADWLGVFEYEEYWDNGINDVVPFINYRLELYEQKENVYANFQAIGFQTEIDILAEVNGNENKVELYIIEGTINSLPVDNIDSILLTLYKEDNLIKTQWGEVSPVIENPRGDYFQRTESTLRD